MSFTPSPQQAAFLAAVSTKTGPSVVLEAAAGAGKTTTLVEGLRVMNGSIAFMAFNKKIVKEIEAKARERGVFDPMYHTISTVHSAGFTAIRAVTPRVKTDERKMLKIVRELTPATDEDGQKAVPVVAKLVGLAKQALLLPTKDMRPAWAALARRHSLDDEMPKSMKMLKLVKTAQDALIQSNAVRAEIIDFDDMVYLPAAFGDYPVRQFDWVLLDEAQDTNAARRELARKMLRPGGRLCAVGDRHQALYAFTGADTGALDRIVEEFDAITLPLSVSYRCPRAVVQEARQHVSHIEAHPTAPEGLVGHTYMDAGASLAKLGIKPGDAILCRLNRPLVKTAYSLIREGVPCRIEGRDIGRTLIAVVKKASLDGSDSLAMLREGLALWLAEQIAEAEAKESDAMRNAAEDKAGAVAIFLDRAQEKNGQAATREHVIAEIEALFADDIQNSIVLSTIHKAKGREWKRVFWLQAEWKRRRPMQEWEKETETCCNYVAITRAQHELRYLHIAD